MLLFVAAWRAGADHSAASSYGGDAAGWPDLPEKLQAVPCQAWKEVSQWPLTAHGRWPQRPDLQRPEPGLPRRTRAEIRGSPLLYGAVGPETSFSGSSLDGSVNTYSQHSLSFRQDRVGRRYVMMAVLAPSSGLLSQWISLDPKHPCPAAHTMRRVSELERGPSLLSTSGYKEVQSLASTGPGWKRSSQHPLLLREEEESSICPLLS